MTTKSITKNYLYNFIYQFISIAVPIILIPFLTRRLGADGIGLYSYTHSIVMYFSYFALLGVSFYGTKMISIHKNDPIVKSKVFIEIFILKVITSCIALVAFYVLSIFLDNQLLFWIQGGILVSNLLDINWYYSGLEDFKTIVFRNSVVKLATLVSVLIFIYSPEHVWLYALIWVGSEFLGQIFIWFDFRKHKIFEPLKKVQIRFKPLNHLKGALLMFLPQMIITLYTTLNISMLGLISGTTETGFYDTASKIVNTLITLITSLGAVMIPRISELHSNNKDEEIRLKLIKAINIYSYLALPMLIGILCTVNIFIPWFLGAGFSPVILVMIVYSIKLIIVPYTNVTGTQYLIPTNKNDKYIISVGAGAGLNIILNLVLMPQYGALGAAFATIMTELVIFIIQYLFIKGYLDVIKQLLLNWKLIFASCIMGLVVMSVNLFLIPKLSIILMNFLSNDLTTTLNLLILISTGIIVYVIMLFILQEDTQKEVLSKISQIIKIKREENK